MKYFRLIKAVGLFRSKLYHTSQINHLSVAAQLRGEKAKKKPRKKKKSSKAERVAGKRVKFFGKGKNLLWAFNDTTELL